MVRAMVFCFRYLLGHVVMVFKGGSIMYVIDVELVICIMLLLLVLGVVYLGLLNFISGIIGILLNVLLTVLGVVYLLLSVRVLSAV